jgi:hypothetical protein
MCADNHGIFVCLTAHNLDSKNFRDIHFFDLIVDIACLSAAKPQEP